MVSNRLPVIFIALAILLAILYSSIFVVNAREQAIVVRFGQIQSVKTEPGLYFKLPFGFMDADRVQLWRSAPCGSTSIISAFRFRTARPSMSMPS